MEPIFASPMLEEISFVKRQVGVYFVTSNNMLPFVDLIVVQSFLLLNPPFSQIHFAEEIDASLSNWPEANHEVILAISNF